MRKSLLLAISKLDENEARAVYNALASHIENESEYLESLKDSPYESEILLSKQVEKDLLAVSSVVDSC